MSPHEANKYYRQLFLISIYGHQGRIRCTRKTLTLGKSGTPESVARSDNLVLKVKRCLNFYVTDYAKRRLQKEKKPAV